MAPSPGEHMYRNVPHVSVPGTQPSTLSNDCFWAWISLLCQGQIESRHTKQVHNYSYFCCRVTSDKTADKVVPEIPAVQCKIWQ